MMKLIVSILLAVSFVSMAYAAEPLATEEQKTLYAIGQTLFKSLQVFNLTPAEFEIVKQGLTESHAGLKTDLDPTAYNQKVQEFAKARRKAEGDRQAGATKEFLEKITKEKGSVITRSGIVYLSHVEGKGAPPKATDTVKVHYRGTLIDGKEFDSSFKRGTPLEVKLNGVIKCWTEGLQLMKPGGKAKLVCPPSLAYGDTGAGDLILPGAALVFEVELLEVKPTAVSTPPPPAASTQPAAAPKAPGPRVTAQPLSPAVKQ